MAGRKVVYANVSAAVEDVSGRNAPSGALVVEVGRQGACKHREGIVGVSAELCAKVEFGLAVVGFGVVKAVAKAKVVVVGK